MVGVITYLTHRITSPLRGESLPSGSDPRVGAQRRVRGLSRVKVAGTVDGSPFTSAFMPLGHGVHKLPITAKLRRAIGNESGSTVTVTLERRLN